MKRTTETAFAIPLCKGSTFIAGGGVTAMNPISSRRATRPMIGHRQSVRQAPMTMGLFGLGFPEIAVIAGIGILVFGPSKIAGMGKDLGGIAGGVKKATAEFKEAMEDSLEEADREIERKKKEKEAREASSTTITQADQVPVEKKDT